MRKTYLIRYCLLFLFMLNIHTILLAEEPVYSGDELTKNFFPAGATLLWKGSHQTIQGKNFFAVLHSLIKGEKDQEGRTLYLIDYFQKDNEAYHHLWRKVFDLPPLIYVKCNFFNIDLDDKPDLIVTFVKDNLLWYNLIFAGAEGRNLLAGDASLFDNDFGPLKVPEAGRVEVPWTVFWYESPYGQPGRYFQDYIWQNGNLAPMNRPGATIFAWPNRSSIVIDGRKNEWPAKAESCHPIYEKRLIYWQMDTWNGKEDLSGNIAVLWDQKGLYLLIKVMDDVVKPAVEGMDIWKGDLVELWFDWSLWPDYQDTRMNQDDLHLGIQPKINGSPINIVVLGGDLKMQMSEAQANGGLCVGGYWLEVALPWPAGFNAQENTTIGFAVSFSDTDTEDKPLQTIIANQPGFQWQNPVSFGNLTLIKEGVRK